MQGFSFHLVVHSDPEWEPPLHPDSDLCQQGFDNPMLLHAGKPELKHPETKGQATVINAQQVQDGGMDVMDMHRILDNMEAQLIRATHRDAPPDATSGKPHGKGLQVGIATGKKTLP